jgi:hypothetical protein
LDCAYAPNLLYSRFSKRARGQTHDARRRAPTQRGDEQTGEQEVPEMVGRELELPALRCARERTRHDARVVDQDVQLGVALQVALCEATNALWRGELDLADLDLCASALADRRRDPFALRQVPTRQRDGCSRLG